MVNQLKSDLARSLVLGVLNGAIYSAIQFILISGYYNLMLKLDVERMERTNVNAVQMTEMLDKRFVSFWFLLAFTIASYFWHRYSHRIQKSPILFWEAIGLSAVVSWNIVVLSLLWIESRLTGQTLGYNSAISLSNPLFGPFSLGLVIVTNFFYGASLALPERFSGGGASDETL